MASTLKIAGGIGVTVAVIASAHADVTLQNDGFSSGGTAAFKQGFGVGDMGASSFLAPAPARQLLKVQLLYGGMNTMTKTVTFKVWDDTAGTAAPGTELYSMDFQLTGADSAIQEIDVTADNVIVPQQFRAGLLFPYAGAPSIARDTDGSIMAGKNFIYDAPSAMWHDSKDLFLQGDWIIRAVISGTSTGADAGVNPTPDASTVGATCTSNAQCSVGEFCDTTNHQCTFECRTSADCGNGGTCNSLGMCVGGGSKSGGCCSAGRGAQGSIALGLFTLGLVFRRRRRA